MRLLGEIIAFIGGMIFAIGITGSKWLLAAGLIIIVFSFIVHSRERRAAQSEQGK